MCGNHVRDEVGICGIRVLMELGESKEGRPSWAARVLKLRDDSKFGPFKLAFLETLLRAADWRGSSKEKN